MSLRRSTSSLPPASVSRFQSIAPGASAATGASSMGQTVRFALRPSHCGLRAAAVAQLEIEVARVDENSESLAQDENRVADIEGIEQEQHATADREEPEGDRHHHFSRALGGDPLHQEAHGEHDLRHVTEQHPPLELGHEDFMQVAADRL